MAGGRLSQVGTKAEVTYGTAIAVTDFTEYIKESVTNKDERIESKGLRAGYQTLGTTQWVPGRSGAEGDVEMEVQYNGMGGWLRQMFGSVATTEVGDNTPNVFKSVFSQATLNTLDSQSFTCQIGRPQLDGTVIPYTYDGCKVTEWEFSVEENGLAELKVSIVTRKETVGGASEFSLQTAVFVDPTIPYSFARFTVSIGGTAVPVRKLMVKASNALQTDRWFLGSRYRNAPVEGSGSITEYTVSMDMDYVSPTLYALVAAGTPTAVEVDGIGPLVDDAGSEYRFTVKLPAVRFDGDTVNVEGPKLLEQTLMGRALDNGTNDPISVEYTSLTAYSTPV